MTRLFAANLAFAMALAACAPAPEHPGGTMEGSSAHTQPEGRSCFSPRLVSGFREAPESASGAEQVYIDVGRDTYLFETFGGCPDLDFSYRIGLDQRIPGQICDGLDVDLIVPDAALGPRSCPVRMVRKLGADEEGSRWGGRD
ncbi:DUF6491 family protein [Pelagerythrobacter sp.]|uniref:DUF6491 family protein n=1 Tax=Pelagerythrobacter sp. TaxID=2800702 RepID=UPI0035AF6275